MSKNKLVTFRACFHADSVGTDSFCVLVDCVGGGWSNKQWFGLKLCSYEIIDLVCWVTAPEWLLEKKGVLALINKNMSVCNYCLEFVSKLEDGFGCKECCLKYKKQ